MVKSFDDFRYVYMITIKTIIYMKAIQKLFTKNVYLFNFATFFHFLA